MNIIIHIIEQLKPVDAEDNKYIDFEKEVNVKMQN